MLYITGKYSLAEAGEQFADSYILFKLYSKNETVEYEREILELVEKITVAGEGKQAVDDSVELLDVVANRVKAAFVEGSIWDHDAKKQRAMVVDDLDAFPVTMLKPIMKFIEGGLEKKA